MNAAQLKLEIFRKVDGLDSSKLEALYGTVLNFINSKNENIEWQELSLEQREGIDAAISTLEQGKGISHQQVLSNFRHKYKNV